MEETSIKGDNYQMSLHHKQYDWPSNIYQTCTEKLEITFFVHFKEKKNFFLTKSYPHFLFRCS